jgi:hypothetical protein
MKDWLKKQHLLFHIAVDLCNVVVYNSMLAGVAQLVEQLICNQQVVGSTPIASLSKSLIFHDVTQSFCRSNFV